MSRDRARSEAELTEAFAAHGDGLRRFIQRAFPRLADEAADIAHDALLGMLRRVRDEGFRTTSGWMAWLRRVARHRAIDRLRSWERRMFRQLAAGTSDGAERVVCE